MFSKNISQRTNAGGTITQIVSNKDVKNGKETYYESTNDRATYGWEKTSTSTSVYTVEYDANGKATRTTYQQNADNTKESARSGKSHTYIIK